MMKGIKRLVHEDIGLPWRGRYDTEQSARKNYLKANSPREGFKDCWLGKESAEAARRNLIIRTTSPRISLSAHS
jgi:hypothetical protein